MFSFKFMRLLLSRHLTTLAAFNTDFVEKCVYSPQSEISEKMSLDFLMYTKTEVLH